MNNSTGIIKNWKNIQLNEQESHRIIIFSVEKIWNNLIYQT